MALCPYGPSASLDAKKPSVDKFDPKGKAKHKAHRKDPHAISRSTFEIFLVCQRCFWMDRRFR